MLVVAIAVLTTMATAPPMKAEILSANAFNNIGEQYLAVASPVSGDIAASAYGVGPSGRYSALNETGNCELARQ